MISVDTNILARLLLKDDPKQYRQTKSLLEGDEEVYVPITVLLELAWVLRVRDSTRQEILAALRGIVDLPQVRPQHPDAVRRAFAWIEGGMDIADALHIALSERVTQFVSFDQGLAKRARLLGARPPVATP
jgi:predicted nucleic acid-binding protein